MSELYDFLTGRYQYLIIVFLMMAGLYVVIASPNLIKRMIGLSIFQTSIFLMFISLGKTAGGLAPILKQYYKSPPNPEIYSNPLPHVLILTAIVVGVATLALGLALAARIHAAYGSLNANDLDDPEPGT